jgi:UPF0716 protein FxsA
MKLLIILLVLLPFVELYLLFVVADALGAGPAFALVILTGIAGLVIVGRVGWRTLARVSEEVERGELPGPGLFDSMMKVIAGGLLLLPGVLTDAVGLLLLIPPLRHAVRKGVVAWYRRQSGRRSGGPGSGDWRFTEPNTIDAKVISRHSEPEQDQS